MAIKGAKTIAEYAIRKWLENEGFVMECFPDCGKEMYAPKRGGRKTAPGHLKWLYCPWCRKTQNMVQVE